MLAPRRDAHSRRARRGSCVAPDTCSCPDGWAGHDCNTRACVRACSPAPSCAGRQSGRSYCHFHAALCRHRNAYGDVVSCQNGGLCSRKDRCTCVQVSGAARDSRPVCGGSPRPVPADDIHPAPRASRAGQRVHDGLHGQRLQHSCVPALPLPPARSRPRPAHSPTHTLPHGLAARSEMRAGPLRARLHQRGQRRRGLLPVRQWRQLHCARLLLLPSRLARLRLPRA